jgi:hypothetical protein
VASISASSDAVSLVTPEGYQLGFEA